MYYIYHIPKRKEWGCTKFLEKRVKKIGYTISDIDRVILVSDIDKAADLERDLNIEYGYGWISSKDYRVITKAQKSVKIESKSKGGKNAFLVNKEKGNMQSLYVKGGKALTSIEKECPHCGIKIKQPAIYMHIKKCKLIVK